jgi:hypothetical protein
MNESPRKSRLGFAVIKLRVTGLSYYLMRVNPKWKDVNFVGGHDKPRDRGDLKTTARRELWEEVPSVRSYADFDLEPITDEFQYGPVFSRSKGDKVQYNLQFFLLRINYSPKVFVETLSVRTKNVWLTEQEMLSPQRYRLSGLVELLNEAYPGGLAAIAYSYGTDLGPLRGFFEQDDSRQLEFALK